ncbi:hypothetical protein AB4Z03_30770 [Bacillus sp. YAF12_1]|uniref:hypothetical protein n=1 Tax=Bacillus sp. YAF12_1 TaxID=3237484 RepID=UPI003F91A5E0
MQSTEAHMKEKQRREKIEIIFSHRVKGESYFHGSSYQWKNIVYQNYDRIQQKEMEVEQLISEIEKSGIHFNNNIFCNKCKGEEKTVTMFMQMLELKKNTFHKIMTEYEEIK